MTEDKEVNEHQLFLQRAGIESIEDLQPENLVKALVEKNPDYVNELVTSRSKDLIEAGSTKVKDEISGLLTNKLKKHLITNFDVNPEEFKDLNDFGAIIEKAAGSVKKAPIVEEDNSLNEKYNLLENSRRELEISLQQLRAEKDSLETSLKAKFENDLHTIQMDGIIKGQFNASKLTEIVKKNSESNLNILKTAVTQKYDIKPVNGEYKVFNKDGSTLYVEGSTNQQTLENIVNSQINDLGWVKSELNINPLSPTTKSRRTSSSRKGFNYPTRK